MQNEILNVLRYELRTRRCTTPFYLSEEEVEEILNKLKKDFKNIKVNKIWTGEVVFYR